MVTLMTYGEKETNQRPPAPKTTTSCLQIMWKGKAGAEAGKEKPGRYVGKSAIQVELPYCIYASTKEMGIVWITVF